MAGTNALVGSGGWGGRGGVGVLVGFGFEEEVGGGEGEVDRWWGGVCGWWRIRDGGVSWVVHVWRWIVTRWLDTSYLYMMKYFGLCYSPSLIGFVYLGTWVVLPQ